MYVHTSNYYYLIMSILLGLPKLNLIKKPYLVGPVVYQPHFSDEIVTYSDLLRITELAVAKPGFKSSCLIPELAF